MYDIFETYWERPQDALSPATFSFTPPPILAIEDGPIDVEDDPVPPPLESNSAIVDGYESRENAPVDPPTESPIAPADSVSPNSPPPPSSWNELMERAQRIRLLGLR